MQCLGRFLDIIGRNPRSFSSPTGYMLWLFHFLNDSRYIPKNPKKYYELFSWSLELQALDSQTQPVLPVHCLTMPLSRSLSILRSWKGLVSKPNYETWRWNSLLLFFLFSFFPLRCINSFWRNLVFKTGYHPWDFVNISSILGLGEVSSTVRGEPAVSYRWTGWVREITDEVWDFWRITNHLRGIYGIYLKWIQKIGRCQHVTGWI